MSSRKLYRTTTFRLNFNPLQHAYFTFLAKNYTFCLNLLTEWVYQFTKNLNGRTFDDVIQRLDYQIRRNDYSTLEQFGFPSKLYRAIYTRLPSAIAQNVWPEALALVLARRNKPQEEWHFRIHYFGFTWTNIGKKNQLLKLPRSKYARQFFKDPVLLMIPEKVYKQVMSETTKWYLRFRWVNGKWFVDIVKTLQLQRSSSQEPKFAAIDINLKDIAFIDEVTKRPVLFSLHQTLHKSIEDFKAYSKYQSKGLEKLAYYRRRKIVSRFKQTFKLYAIRIVKWCKQNGITHIAIGNVRPSIPRDKGIPKWLRKLWNLIPWSYFYDYLKTYAEKFGIWVYKKSEAYTSKCNALNDDILHIDKKQFTGKRITRGLYKSNDGTVIHADINAAANLLKRAVYDITGRIVNFSKYQLSAVRRVGYQILHYLPLDLALQFKQLKDYLAHPGQFWSGVQSVVTAVLQSGLKHGILTSLFRIP